MATAVVWVCCCCCCLNFFLHLKKANSRNLIMRRKPIPPVSQPPISTYSPSPTSATATSNPVFSPTSEYRVVNEGQHIPPGCEVEMNLITGKKLAKINKNYRKPSCLTHIPCPYCHVTFDNYCQLKEHIEAQHPPMYSTEEAPEEVQTSVWKCDICLSEFSSSDLLLQHT